MMGIGFIIVLKELKSNNFDKFMKDSTHRDSADDKLIKILSIKRKKTAFFGKNWMEFDALFVFLLNKLAKITQMRRGKADFIKFFSDFSPTHLRNFGQLLKMNFIG